MISFVHPRRKRLFAVHGAMWNSDAVYAALANNVYTLVYWQVRSAAPRPGMWRRRFEEEIDAR